MDPYSYILSTDTSESYLLGRGGKRTTFESMRIGQWEPDDEAEERWPSAKNLSGWLAVPYQTLSGKLVGCVYRNMRRKQVLRINLNPEIAEYSASWICQPDAAERIWNGANVWLVEGVFDMFALQWAVPDTDVVMACGTAALSDPQTESLRRIKPRLVHMVFDMDAAGRNGSEWAVRKLKKVGIKTIEHQYMAKDPGVLWDKGGAELVRQVFRAV